MSDKFLPNWTLLYVSDIFLLAVLGLECGTWNVRSLFWPGALKVLHNELSKLDFDVAVLQETRLESGISKYDNFVLFNSGLER
jgi:hypothetical protein